MRDHRIVVRIGVLGNVEILLNNSPRVEEKRPVGADSAAIFIRFRDVVGADGDEPAIADLEFAVELNQRFGLTAVSGTETAAAEDEN